MNLSDLISANPEINVTVKAIDLWDFGELIATQAVRIFIEKNEERIYSRQDVISKFKICSATLWRWEKNKLITSKKIRNRSFYSESDIKKLMHKEG